MASKPKPKEMSSNGNRIDRHFFDIIECTLRNDFRGVDKALARDPDAINAQRTDSGITPLMAASGRGLERMASHLLSKEGIDLSIADDFGRDAFEHARLFPEIVALLVNHAYPKMRWKEPGLFPV